MARRVPASAATTAAAGAVAELCILSSARRKKKQPGLLLALTCSIGQACWLDTLPACWLATEMSSAPASISRLRLREIDGRVRRSR